MKYIFIIVIVLIISFSINSCYTLLEHPEIEVYYEKESGADSLAENYDVFVDEDCASCHNDFFIQLHFNPMISAHQSAQKWDNLPWWFDNKYLYIFDNNQADGVNDSDTYQHVQSRENNYINGAQSSGYLPASSGGYVSGSSSTSKKTNDNSANDRTAIEGDPSNSGSEGRSSGSSSSSSTRKFRKRR